MFKRRKDTVVDTIDDFVWSELTVEEQHFLWMIDRFQMGRSDVTQFREDLRNARGLIKLASVHKTVPRGGGTVST